MLPAAIIDKGQYLVKGCAVSCQVLTLYQTTFQTAHVPGIAFLSLCQGFCCSHQLSGLSWCHAEHGEASDESEPQARHVSCPCGARPPALQTMAACAACLKARQPARTATSAPQGGHASRCGPSLAQARHLHTLSSLNVTHTSLACARLALVCPAWQARVLGPGERGLDARHRGLPARPGLHGTNLSDYSLARVPGGPAYSISTGATCSCTAAGLSCKVATHLASRVLLRTGCMCWYAGETL